MMSKDIKQALAYVASNVERDEVALALTRMYRYRTPLYVENPRLHALVYDLLEEYGEDNELPEGWWLEELEDTDEVLLRIAGED